MTWTGTQRKRRAQGLCADCGEQSTTMYRCVGCLTIRKFKRQAQKDAATGLTHEQRVARGRFSRERQP